MNLERSCLKLSVEKAVHRIKVAADGKNLQIRSN